MRLSCPILLMRLSFCVLSVAVALRGAYAEESEEVAAIRAEVQSYIQAFNSRDVPKLLRHWSAEGVYINRETGDRVAGRENLAASFQAMFAEKPAPRLSVHTKSIRLVSPNVALEQGTAVVERGSNSAVETEYTVVYVRRAGKWLIDRVTDESSTSIGPHYSHLKKLSWLIGEWVDDGGDVSIEYSCRWTANRNYISRMYSVRLADGTKASGLQLIGWDANQQRIRSWLFDSDGGRVTGDWTQNGDRWLVHSTAVLADGTTGSFTSIFDEIKDDSFRWRKVEQVVDGKLLPNIDEVTVRRK